MQHEHEFEASPGLPEKLPEGERILWQGAPDAWLMAVHALHVRKVALYFAAMMALQVLWMPHGGQTLTASLALSAALAAVALALLGVTAWLAARTTLYTLTNRRVVMRIGIVLTLSINLPLRQIAGASIKPLSSAHGDIALQLRGADRIAWLHLWPHARPWELRRPQPALRCLPQVQAVGALLMQAWQAAQPAQAVAVEPLGAASPDAHRPLAQAPAAVAAPAARPAASRPASTLGTLGGNASAARSGNATAVGGAA